MKVSGVFFSFLTRDKAATKRVTKESEVWHVVLCQSCSDQLLWKNVCIILPQSELTSCCITTQIYNLTLFSEIFCFVIKKLGFAFAFCMHDSFSHTHTYRAVTSKLVVIRHLALSEQMGSNSPGRSETPIITITAGLSSMCRIVSERKWICGLIPVIILQVCYEGGLYFYMTKQEICDVLHACLADMLPLIVLIQKKTKKHLLYI